MRVGEFGPAGVRQFFVCVFVVVNWLWEIVMSSYEWKEVKCRELELLFPVKMTAESIFSVLRFANSNSNSTLFYFWGRNGLVIPYPPPPLPMAPTIFSGLHWSSGGVWQQAIKCFSPCFNSIISCSISFLLKTAPLPGMVVSYLVDPSVNGEWWYYPNWHVY